MGDGGNVNKKQIRILSIQSHVIRGCVGNRAAVFPLQLLGFQVDIINSVQFASMYVHEGQVFSGNELSVLLNGLLKAIANPFGGGHPGALVKSEIHDAKTDYTHILSGYVNDVSFLLELVKFVKRIKQANQNQIQWICDPVIGDNGKLYVTNKLVDVFKTEVLPLADIVTPNHFELQWLTDVTTIRREFSNTKEVFDLSAKIHEIGPKVVVVTSVPLEGNEVNLFLVASERVSDENGFGWRQNTIVIPFHRHKVYLGGTGDLMTAMVLAGLEIYNGNLLLACEGALSILQRVMQQTLVDDPEALDINVVQIKNCITWDSVEFKAATSHIMRHSTCNNID